MQRIMIDLETLGLTPGAALLEIGIVDIDDPGHAMHLAIDDEMGIRDPDTEAWWEARGGRNALEGVERVDLRGALARTVLEFGKADELWAFGVSFDVPLLQASFALAGVEWPWDYHGFRCSRTVIETAKDLGWAQPDRQTAHSALPDAIAQAEDLRSALEWLRTTEGDEVGASS